MPEEQQFLFDDFFYKDDETLPVSIEVRGLSLPFKLKRGVSSADLAAAKRAVVKMHIDEKSGKVLVDPPDPAEFEAELLARAIKAWPFKQPKMEEDGNPVVGEDGAPVLEPVPITRANMELLAGDVSQALSVKVMALMQEAQSSLDPFGKASVGAS